MKHITISVAWFFLLFSIHSFAFCPRAGATSDSERAKQLLSEKPLPLPSPSPTASVLPGKPTEETEVARVKTFGGAVTIIRAEKIVKVGRDEKVFIGDQLQTGADGTIGITFKDNSTLSLGNNSTLVIQEFLFAPAQGKLSLVNRIVKGTAAYISGLIVKLAPQAVRFETPVATVGFRGTTLLMKIEEEKEK